MSKVYKDDTGTVFQVDVGVDISAASTVDLKVRKPDGSIVTWTGSINGSVNTQIDYTIVTDDLDQTGKYTLQSYVVTATWTGRGESVGFLVYDNFT